MRKCAPLFLILILTPLLASAQSASACPSLSLGSRGSQVIQVQQILHAAYKDFPAPTGFFGPVTQNALKKWQGERGLEQVGEVGPKTAALMRLCEAAPIVVPDSNDTSSAVSKAALIESLLAQLKVLQAKLAELLASAVTTTSQSTFSNSGGSSTNYNEPTTSIIPASGSSGGGPSNSTGTQVENTQASNQSPNVPAGRITSQSSLENLPSLAYPSSSTFDFLIPDVCVDSSDVPTKGDPATCSRHRNMRFGEFIPYMHTDNSARGSASSWFGFPTQAPDGSLLIMNVFDWGGFLKNTAYTDFDISNPSDGIDLIELNGPHVSIIATQNNVQPLSPLWNPACNHDDTWKIFPANLSVGDVGTATSSLAFGITCPSSFATALNVWHYYGAPQPTTYTSGKKLGSLIEWHYDNADPRSAGSFEQLYFTKEYGVTRWEAWQTVDHCLNAIVPNTPGLTSAYCEAGRTPQCNGVDTLSNVWGKNYIRVDCHDLTYVQDYDLAFNPLVIPTGGDLVLSKNLLKSGDFAQGLTTAWQRTGNSSLTWNTRQRANNNWYLVVQCVTDCTGGNNNIHQDIQASGIRGRLRLMFGAVVGASAETRLTMRISIISAQGVRMGGKEVVMQVGSAQHRDDSFDWDFDAQPASIIRYEIQLDSASTEYSIDDAYLTPVRI